MKKIDKTIEKYIREGSSYTADKIGHDTYEIEGNKELTDAIISAYEENPKSDEFKYIKKFVKAQGGKRIVLKFDTEEYGKLKGGPPNLTMSKVVNKIIKKYYT